MGTSKSIEVQLNSDAETKDWKLETVGDDDQLTFAWDHGGATSGTDYGDSENV